jgi:hypothetical protein
LGDALASRFERDAFAPIQRSQSVLNSLTELKLVNSVNQGCVGWKLLRYFQENLFRAHDSVLYIIAALPPTILYDHSSSVGPVAAVCHRRNPRLEVPIRHFKFFRR